MNKVALAVAVAALVGTSVAQPDPGPVILCFDEMNSFAGNAEAASVQLDRAYVQCGQDGKGAACQRTLGLALTTMQRDFYTDAGSCLKVSTSCGSMAQHATNQTKPLMAAVQKAQAACQAGQSDCQALVKQPTLDVRNVALYASKTTEVCPAVLNKACHDALATAQPQAQKLLAQSTTVVNACREPNQACVQAVTALEAPVNAMQPLAQNVNRQCAYYPGFDCHGVADSYPNSAAEMLQKLKKASMDCGEGGLRAECTADVQDAHQNAQWMTDAAAHGLIDCVAPTTIAM